MALSKNSGNPVVDLLLLEIQYFLVEQLLDKPEYHLHEEDFVCFWEWIFFSFIENKRFIPWINIFFWLFVHILVALNQINHFLDEYSLFDLDNVINVLQWF